MANDEFTLEPLGAPVFRPHIRWSGGYRVVNLGLEGETLALPGKVELLTPSRIRGQHNILVFGERGGGIRDFLLWLTEVLEDQEWVLVCASEWAPDFFQWPNRMESKEKPDRQQDPEPPESKIPSVKEAAEKAIGKLGSGENTMERAEALIGWAKSLQNPFTLIIRDLSSLGDGPSLEVATTLRMVMERKERCPHLRILVADTSESIYLDRPDRSGYRALTVQYRLPSLTREEIRKLAEWFSEGLDKWPIERLRQPLLLSDEALKKIFEHTGGQPLLVQRLLKGLQRFGSITLDPGHVEQEARTLRLSPPDETKFWQKDLRDLLRKDPSLLTAMQAYLLGKSLGPARFPPPSAERALFIAGWVKLNSDGRWGISSQFHAHLAREVLQDLERKAQ